MLFFLWIVLIFEPLCHCQVIQFLKCCDYQVTAKVELNVVGLGCVGWAA